MDREFRVKELAEMISAEIIGDDDFKVQGVGGADNASATDITFAQNREYLALARENAGAIIVSEDLVEDEIKLPLLVVDNPRLAFAKLARKFEFKPYQTGEIADDAVISPKAEVGANVSIHPGVVVEAEAEIGDNAVIAANSYIGHQVKIGPETVIHPNVTIEYKSQIGARVEIHAGTVIASDGYGFETNQDGHTKVPQFGNVIVEDDVEIGANVTIDRGATGSTKIGAGTKIDNLVHLAHNVKVGPESLIIAQVGIAGSSEVGKRATLAGKSGLVGHIKVGDNVTVGAYSAVTKDIGDNKFVSGYPAHNHRLERRIKAARKRLPRLLKDVKNLERKIRELEEEVEKDD